MESDKIAVALVDDSVGVRALVRTRLEASGDFEIVGEGADGEDAIALVVRHRPDLVLLDLSMPAMDGLETLPAILAVRPETAVVVFSGFGGPDLEQRVRELGAVDLVEKSIPLEDLPDRLRDSLRGATTAPGADPGRAPDLRVVAAAPHGDADAAEHEQALMNEHIEGFRALFDHAAIGMATLTVHATIVRANHALAELMSCDPSDLVGVDYGRLTAGRGDVLDRHLDALRSSRETVATFEHPIPGPRGAREPRTALVTLAPIRDSTGQALYVFAQVQDISAQRRAEDDLRRSETSFRLLVAAVEEYAIFMLDTEGRVSSWNAGARRIKGYDTGEVLGQHFRVFYPEEEQLSGHPERNLEVALREGSYAEEGWRVRRDGSRFWASVVITAVHDDRGRHVGFAKVTRDHTDQLHRPEDSSEAMAEQMRLLAVTAHELRNPTAVIDGSARALQTSAHRMRADEREKHVRAIRGSAHRLGRLASDLSAASQLQGGGMRYRLDDVSLDELVGDAAVRRAAAGGDAHLHVAVPAGIVVRGDEVRLGQALDNLIDNAERHGVPPIAVGARLRGDEVELRVTDAGPGVPQAVAPHLFECFATGGATQGTGLGLHLAREIARGHGGSLTYEPPVEGSATTFVLRLPAGVANP